MREEFREFIEEPVDYKKAFIKAEIKLFLLENPIENYTCHRGRVVGKTPEATKRFIEFIDYLELSHDVSGADVAHEFILFILFSDSYRPVSADKESPREELQELSAPLVDWLNRNGTPHSKIIITQVSSELLSGEVGISYEPLD